MALELQFQAIAKSEANWRHNGLGTSVPSNPKTSFYGG